MSDTAPQTAEVGVIGMAVMGSNLARNMARKGFRVAIYNRTASRTDEVIAGHGNEGTFLPFHDLANFVASLERPRRVVMMVKAGCGTDAVIKEITLSSNLVMSSSTVVMLILVIPAAVRRKYVPPAFTMLVLASPVGKSGPLRVHQLCLAGLRNLTKSSDRS